MEFGPWSDFRLERVFVARYLRVSERGWKFSYFYDYYIWWMEWHICVWRMGAGLSPTSSCHGEKVLNVIGLRESALEMLESMKCRAITCLVQMGDDKVCSLVNLVSTSKSPNTL
jgi:hypothetical protein